MTDIIDNTIKDELNKYIEYTDPDVLGEALRNLAFDQTEGTGCYSSFDVRPFMRPVDNDNLARLTLELLLGDFWNDRKEVNRIRAFRHAYLPIFMAYYWDGDGTLLFQVDDLIVINYDCKKSYGWRFGDDH